MNRTQLSGLLVTTLVAIVPLPAIAQPLQFQCDQGSNFEARIEKDQAKVRFASGETKTLLPVDSLVGKKFSDGRMLLFVNDTEAWIEVNYIKVHTECVAQQSPANFSSNR
jgi:membrane-bound inhibitor of C-type lysozyme